MIQRVMIGVLFLLLSPGAALGATLSVACAANFAKAMQEIADAYEAAAGVVVRRSFGSTGALYGQIVNQAPYDLFFAADEKRPALLHEQGLAGEPAVYATGKVALWSWRDIAAGDWQSALEGLQRVAAPNPRTAPYGAAALQALRRVGRLEAVRGRLVYGKNVSQAFQFAHARAADAVFAALSQALASKDGRWWLVPEAGLVRQAACVLGDEPEARRFLEFAVESPQARAVKQRHGYE